MVFRPRHLGRALVSGIALSAAAVFAQQSEQAPPMPKPGPEHAVLRAEVGTWDATVETFEAAGAPPSTSKGVEVNTMLGDMFLITDFKSEFMGMPFQGHGVSGWDPVKKKYVGTWVDNMSAGPMLGETTYDAAKKRFTGQMVGPDTTGKMMTMREVTDHPDPDTRIFSMYGAGAGGKEALMMRITYKRRK